MKDYYKILEVSPNATQEEIKRAYRKLAFQYHPDRNSSPIAQTLIQEINVAYDVIGDVKKREAYNFRYNSRNTTHPPVNSTARKKRSAPYTDVPPPRKNYKKAPRFDFKGWAEKGKYVSAFILFYCSLLSLDYYISTVYEETIVEDAKVIKHESRRRSSNFTAIIESTKVNFEMAAEGLSLEKGDIINVDITPLFGLVKTVDLVKDGEVIELPHIITFYSPIFFIIVVLMGTSIGAILSKSPETSFNLSSSNVILFLIVIAIKWIV